MKRWILGGLAALLLILLLATVYFPCALSSPAGMNESSAVGSIRAIIEAEERYRATYGGYAPALASLGGSQPCTASAATACLLDTVLTEGNKAGYRFMVVGGEPVHGKNTTYVASAVPLVQGRTGIRLFCTTEKGVIRLILYSARNTLAPNREQCEKLPELQ